MELTITQDKVDEIIDHAVREKLDALMFEWNDWNERSEPVPFARYVKKKVDEKIEEYLEVKFAELVDEEVAQIARHEVMAEFLTKPVRISDGWRTKEYDNYNSFLLERIHAHSLRDWKIQNVISDEVKKRVDALWEECEKDAKTAALASFKSRIEAGF